MKGNHENTETDSIKLMTVHKKLRGLEFKTVYVLSVVEGAFPHDYSLEALRRSS
ncbi:hypothetical protein KHA80_18390 [Anaerobacillus sp. HL2]|nr:hypothetical protein KHA80_18390 [Anaerobacillus sp. HL2]